MMQTNGEPWDSGLEHAALSDTGLRRTSNQDSLVVLPAASEAQWRQRGHLFVVADGMGAHAAGELASKLAADIIPLTYHKLREQHPTLALRQALEDANEKIHGRGQANAEFHGMGTTTSALALLPEGAVVAHVGDSRVYRARRNRIEQLSFDHSLVWEMSAGMPGRRNDVPLYIPKNIITRSLGPNPQVQVDVEGPFPVEAGDYFLLCSDGLSGQVTDDEMATILACLSPDEAVHLLVDLANLRGGPDNITVIAARATRGWVGGDSSVAPTAPPRAAKPGAWVDSLKVAVMLASAAALGIAGVAFFFRQRFLEGIAAGGLAAMLLYFAIQQLRRAAPPPVEEPSTLAGPLGRGPYTSADAQPLDEFAGKLAKVAEELHSASATENWQVDWARFNELRQQAATFASEKRFDQAVQHYSRAISFLMDELRRQRGKQEA